MKMRVILPGLLTTVQDGGRWGYQASGFAVSGCMDMEAFHDANILLNNSMDAAVLEMQFMGGSFSFDCETYIALTGADMNASVNGRHIDTYKAYHIYPGDILEYKTAVNGRFAYLAVAGGFDVPVVLGSRSTNLKCGIGGLEGRKLQAGDEIALTGSTHWILNEYLKELEPPVYDTDVALRVVPTAQEEKFTENGIKSFYENKYIVSEESDRMGFRMLGEPIESVSGVDIISDGIAPGSIQVTPKGMPMILLSDRQTTGGYAKIGTVVSADIPKLVQCMPGREVSFVRVDVAWAERILRDIDKTHRRKRHMTGYVPGNEGFFEHMAAKKGGIAK